MKRKLLGSKKPPKGFEKIEPELIDLQIRLREAETDSSDNKRKNEIVWPILNYIIKYQDLFLNHIKIRK